MELQHETIYLRQGLLSKWKSPLMGKFVSPRVAVLHQYIKDGWSGTFDKGDLLFTLLKCMAFKQLPLCLYMYETSGDYSKWISELGKGDPIDRDGYPNIFNMFYNHRPKWNKLGLGSLDKRINDIMTISESEIRANAELLISNSPLTMEQYRGERRRYADYTPDMIIDLFNSINRRTLVQLAENMSHKKYHYNFSFGYPDILIYKDGKVKFIKVNAVARDKIWDTQAFTFEKLLLPLGFNITVCQVQPDKQHDLPDYLCNQDAESVKNIFKEAVSEGELNTVNDILGNISSLCSLGFEDANSITDTVAKYFNNKDCSQHVAEHFIKKIVLTNISQDEFETFFYLYFTKQLDSSTHDIRKNLLPVFLRTGIETSLLTSVLCKYIKEYAWYCDVKYYDECYVELLLEHGADPNLDVREEPHGYSDITNAMKIAGDFHYESNFTTYSLFRTLVKYDGDIRIAIESCDLYLGGGLLDLQLKGFNVELKPNHIGRDYETDVTRELKGLMFDMDVPHVLKTLSMLKKAGADFNSANKYGDTPLHVVIDIEIILIKDYEEVIDVIKYLLNENISTNLENAAHKTPIIKLITSINKRDKKTQYKAKNIIDFLFNNGVSACQTTSNGSTVFHVAAEETPSLLPFLRNYIDREPENIVEAILFKGNKVLNSLESYIDNTSRESMEQALSIALGIKAEKVVDKLLSENLDVIVATKKYRNQAQKNTKHQTYSLFFIKYIAKFQHPNIEAFWQHVLEIDLRDKSRDIAINQLRTLIGEKRTAGLVIKTEKSFVQDRKNITKRTEQFLKRIKRLLSYLNKHDVIAIDIYNYGYAPSDAGVFILERIKSYDIKIEEIKYCWLDTRHAKENSRGGYDGSGALIEAVDSIRIYYSAETEHGMKRTAEEIVEAVKHVNLEAEWDGDVERAVVAKLP